MLGRSDASKGGNQELCVMFLRKASSDKEDRPREREQDSCEPSAEKQRGYSEVVCQTVPG